MKKIIIFGSGGHAKVILDCLLVSDEFEILGYTDYKKYNSDLSKKIKFLGKISQLRKILKGENLKYTKGIVAFGSNKNRKKIVSDVKKICKKFNWANVIHPSAVISNSVKMGVGNVVLSGTIICADTVLKNHVCINTGSSIDHDNLLNNFSSTGPRVTTGGNVKIGELSSIGIGATVKQNILIGKQTVIGAQSYVNKNCKSNFIYFGVPAKKIKKINYIKDL